MGKDRDITALLQRCRSGEKQAVEELFKTVYAELKIIAKARVAREKNLSLQPTALVHEAFLRLFANGDQITFQNRAHFFAIAANVIRRFLVDHARKKMAEKRGGNAWAATFNESLIANQNGSPEDVVIIDDLLAKLAAVDERGARIVELRFFAGMSIEETADALECSPDTVKRGWQKAKLWLFHASETQKKIA